MTDSFPLTAAPPPAEDRPSGRRQALRLGLELVETLVLTALLFLGIHTFVAQPYQIQQTSMETTLLHGQYVLVDKLTPRWAVYQRGDIVVFDAPETWDPGSRGVPYIKRVVGLPGDVVELRDGLVYVNGTELDEPYRYQSDGVPQSTEPQSGETRWTVPDGSLFLLGDHRSNSADSRSFGPIEIAHVIGRAWIRYWPLDTFGILGRPAATPE